MAVLFDFWDTLVFIEHQESQRLKRKRIKGLTDTLVDAGFSVSQETVERIMKELNAESDRVRRKMGREVDLHT